MNQYGVVTRTNPDGTLLPVQGIGRRWTDEAGEHILVMVPGDREVELLHRSNNSWEVKPIPGQGNHSAL